ncbi:RecF/RecN/SMC [Haematococcus lacustris]
MEPVPEQLGIDWQASNGCIDRLEVNNFKSYRGVQNIGPFKSFTAVVGPNGSGKSNLMDAISFVLGVRTAQLRGSLKELLYQNSDGNTDADKPRRGHVKLVYLTDEDQEVVFARHIQPSSSEPDATYQSVYKVDDKAVSFDTYCQRLGGFGILVKVRNFLVFQGDIEAVAAKTPAGLTGLLEQISGSDALKAQYDQLQAQTLAVDEKVAAAFSRKKAVAAERKQKKEQKEEAERYLARQQELRALRTTHALFSLHVLIAERDGAVKERLKVEEQLAKIRADHQGMEQNIDAIKRRAAGHAKSRMLHEKKIKKLQAERDKKMPVLVRAREEGSRLSKRVKAGEADVAAMQQKADDAAARIAQLEKELRSIGKAAAKLEAEVKAHYAGLSAGLGSAEVQTEYNALKAQVVQKTSKLQSELSTLSTLAKADSDALAQTEGAVAALLARAAEAQRQAAESQQRARTASEAASGARKASRAKREEKLKAEGALRTNVAERELLAAQLAEAEAAVREAGAERKEARREQKMREAVAALKRLYPNGVFGRLTDLGKVTRKEYNLALAVAMGREMDSVVVDSERTAREAIQYLKEQHVPPMTFIPLATCKVQPISDRLRSGLGGSACLALDLVEPQRPELERAFHYAFGNTLVCDGVEEARQLAFGGTERHKVVAKDGTQFAKAGLITGGDASSLAGRASRWDEQAVAELKAKAQDLSARLQSLPSVGMLHEAELAASEALNELEVRASYKEAEAKAAQEASQRAEAEAVRANAQAAKQQPEVERLRAAVAARQSEMEALETRMNAVSDSAFAAFSKRLGLASIREYEDAHEAFEARVAKERAARTAQENKIRNQLEYERGRDFAGPLAKRQQDLDKDRARMEEVAEEVAAAQAALDELQRQVDAEQEAISASNVEVERAETELRELRKRGSTVVSDIARLSRQQAAAQAGEEAAEARARDLVSAAALDQVDIPRKPGAAALLEVAEAAAEEEEAAGATQAGPGSGAGGSQSAARPSALTDIDFSSLPRSLTSLASFKDSEAISREQAKQIAELAAELEARVPNLKAVDQYEAVVEREKELVAALDQARKDATAVQQAFASCRQTRHDLFSAAFSHISSAIDEIYKQLTASSVHSLGGTAYLSLENHEEPFLGGIKYTAMPPTKRFRDMEQLSGGEKTVAALALLFAIHSYRPSPFFVLDEVDAALDATNVARVAHYIRDKTRSSDQGRFQSIVISLKDIFYEKADALVGVARDVDLGCSRTFTFDLSAFGEPLPAE